MAAVSNGAKLRSGATRGAKWPIVFSKIQKPGLSFSEKTHRIRRLRLLLLIRLKRVTNLAPRRLDAYRCLRLTLIYIIINGTSN